MYSVGQVLYDALGGLENAIKDKTFIHYPEEVRVKMQELCKEVRSLYNKCTSESLDNKAQRLFYQELNES